jgi:hypothetical protein
MIGSMVNFWYFLQPFTSIINLNKPILSIRGKSHLKYNFTLKIISDLLSFFLGVPIPTKHEYADKRFLLEGIPCFLTKSSHRYPLSSTFGWKERQNIFPPSKVSDCIISSHLLSGFVIHDDDNNNNNN